MAICVTLVGLLVCPTATRAQDPPPKSPTRVSSTRRSRQPIRDVVKSEAARLAAARSLLTQQPAPRHRNWVRRHPVLTGTLVGAGVGLGFMAGQDCRASSDYTCTGLTLFFVGTGAGLGALGGVVLALVLR